MACGVVLRRKAISDYLNNNNISARYSFLCHARSTDSRTCRRTQNVIINCDSSFIMGLRTTNSRFISYYDPYADQESERETWADKYYDKYFSLKLGALARFDWYQLALHFLRANVTISLRLLVKVFQGETLSRRERQLLIRTTSYIIRDVPGSLTIGVPLIRIFLPLFLKLFPNMLPSTFQDKMEQQARKRKLKARIEYAKFLQDTAREMDQVDRNLCYRDMEQTAADFFNFTDCESVNREKFLCFAKLFNDKIILDNISRRRLVNMCKNMGITSYGTDEYLRFMLLERLKSIKKDDKLIRKKGVELLSEAEFRKYCRERGICAGEEEMHQQVFEQIL